MSSLSRPDRHRTPQFTHLGAAKTDLERDSGFSDASSEYLSTVELTDSEESGRNGSILGQDPTGQQVALMGGSYAGLSPMIIMNNFVLNQPSAMSPAENQWGFSSPMEAMPQSQVVLLQPVVSNTSNSSKAGCENTRQSKSYMPILKSYPKIAPHPGDVLTKRVGMSKVRGTSAAGYDQRQRKNHHNHRLYSSTGPQPALHTAVKQNTYFEAAANSQPQATEIQEEICVASPLTATSSVPSYTHGIRTPAIDNIISAEKYQDTSSVDSNKFKRFSNTYNILNKSGLLGITMRTKQLIKENRRTQSQLQQLQEQTAMLLEALSSGDSQLWTKLQLSLQNTEKELCNVKAQTVLV